MGIELWWLLALPVFFGLGWVAARIDLTHLLHESRALPRSYFKGLNFLLNKEPDKAIEAFLEAVKIDPGTIELHCALGSLFRRRGEADRAIRMHQNLVDREDLPNDQRLHALAELGQDYLKAGLLDRAEEIFLKLSDTDRKEEAQRALLEIYQQEKEWQKSIEMESRLPDTRQSLIAQFFCEMAANDILHSRWDAALLHLGEAVAHHRKCVRATLLAGELAWATGRPMEAIETWNRIEQQDPAYLSLVAEKLLMAYHQVGRSTEGVQLLRGYMERHPSLDLLEATFRAEFDYGDAESAYRLVRDELKRNPTLLGLEKLIEAQARVASPERRPDLELIKTLLHNHTRRVARYCCNQCGFKAKQFHWRCPACGGWETYPPKRSEEFDITL
ncbi:MAG: lipopolysaccharide assembly protein LapB [Rhodocyclaceae bacterium]|nr:lipopolysaccharide assembly protein LapB [Rhodocyclaceae bacterium]